MFNGAEVIISARFMLSDLRANSASDFGQPLQIAFLFQDRLITSANIDRVLGCVKKLLDRQEKEGGRNSTEGVRNQIYMTRWIVHGGESIWFTSPEVSSTATGGLGSASLTNSEQSIKKQHATSGKRDKERQNFQKCEKGEKERVEVQEDCRSRLFEMPPRTLHTSCSLSPGGRTWRCVNALTSTVMRVITYR
ncbi:hypothetical protein J6590_028531 [Homalodisca vitripennis]|nr:hypothetical protein J6590_028531 [Homalodisca vitripennis]